MCVCVFLFLTSGRLLGGPEKDRSHLTLFRSKAMLVQAIVYLTCELNFTWELIDVPHIGGSSIRHLIKLPKAAALLQKIFMIDAIRN